MAAFFYFGIKVILCSSVLYGYYYLALRNRSFHQWNRFYLLAALFLSLLIPSIKITLAAPVPTVAAPVVHMITIVADNDHKIQELIKVQPARSSFDLATLSYGIYIVISFLISCSFFKAIINLSAMIGRTRVQRTNLAHLVYTTAAGTPFSFLNYIFWPPKIDPDSLIGKKILHHELVHVRQKHSFDIILINILLIIFWFNPVFWIIRKELQLVHEFIADKNSVGEDKSAFACMVLVSSPFTKNNDLVHRFLSSSLKRRWLMLDHSGRQKFSYASRVAGAFITLLVFSFLSLAFESKKELSQLSSVLPDIYRKAPVETTTIPQRDRDTLKPKATQKTTISQQTKETNNLAGGEQSPAEEMSAKKRSKEPGFHNYRDDAILIGSDVIGDDNEIPEWIRNRKPETQIITDSKEDRNRAPVYPELTPPRKVVYPSRLYNEMVIGANGSDSFSIHLQIYDKENRLVQDDHVRKQTIHGYEVVKLDFSKLRKGVYLVNVRSSDNAYRHTYKLVKDYDP